MRKWGIVITACYALILLGLILPGAVFIVGPRNNVSLSQNILDTLHDFVVWIPIGIFLVGQALLLFFPSIPASNTSSPASTFSFPVRSLLC